jgi:segregation and condensation protein B
VTEQPMGGGAAFWAARGVRIEPEIAADEAEAAEAELEAVDEVEPAEAELEDVAETGVEAVAEVVPRDEDVPEDVVEIVEVDEEVDDVERVEEPGGEDLAEVVLVEVAETEPVVEETPLAGFPQQRSSVPAPVELRPESQPEPDPESDEAASGEPAWQLTGGELALPLPPLKTCVEAILMVVDEPTSVVALAQVLERPTIEVAEALTALAEEYTVQGRGFELREVGLGGDGERTGWRIYSRPECAPVVERFVRDGQQAKLTQAALETLAVVAYRQPVSRSKVSAIRGVNCDGVMRTLLARNLVEEHGNDLETGAVLYQTTGYFLERMALKSLEELPDLAPLLPSAADVDIEDFA